MNKLFLLAGLVLVTGCAATGELDTVPERVTKLEAADNVLKTDLKNLTEKTASLTTTQQQCINHCKLASSRMNKFDRKLDNVFNKALVK